MLTPDQYLGVVAERVQRSGGQLRQIQIGPVNAVLGLFTESILMSTMNYAVVAAPLADVTAAALYDFTGHATQHARANVVGTIGWTAASVVIAGLVGERVHPDAVQAATAKPGNQFGGETRMVAVDLAGGQTHTFTGSKVWGAAVQGSIKAKVFFTFPQPREAYQQLQWAQQQPGYGQQAPQQFPQQPYPQQQPQQPYGQHPGQPPHPGQPQPGQQYPGQPHPGQPQPGQPPQPGQQYPGQPPQHGQPQPGHPGQPRPGQPQPGQPQPGQPQPGQQPGQPQPGQPPQHGQPQPGHPGQSQPPQHGQPQHGQHGQPPYPPQPGYGQPPRGY